MFEQIKSHFVVYGLVGSLLVCMGFYALAIHAHIYRRILAWNALGSGVFLLFGAISQRNAMGASSDPVPQALVITGIVVSVSATALALAIARRLMLWDERGNQ